ncbi:unnamed protein product [Mytilus coruscus]|uniref:Endonuclease/exonuclease/phosphatase domain-containing protein n=1 Tax=Mytilus coruscus TaxID=42192 RepID=A0A6J8C6Z1_MYTCO|nr:unnamed protein product [Mytilus coruscus]
MSDILILQEHWLYNFEKDEIEYFLENFICQVKCVDDTNPISPLQRPRGLSGTAVCYRREIANSVTEKPDGSMRINVIKVNLKPKPLLVIGVYMPCRGGADADNDYRETVDELSEIVLKYKSSCDIVIAGDMNASTARDKPNTRDKIFLDFIQEHCLYIPNGLYDVQNILSSNTPGLVNNFKVLQRHPLNTSQHDPVAGSINVELDTCDSMPVISTLPPRVKWDKVNKDKYEKLVANRLSEVNLEVTKASYSDISNITSEICAVLDTAARACGPTKTRKGRPRALRPWSPAINEACKHSEQKFWEWKCDGRPPNASSLTFCNMKDAKKKLRSTQRQHEALLRKSNYEKIMKAHEGDQQTFYRLIANQRKDGSTQTSCLKVDDELLTTPHGIRNGWAYYSQELATPHHNKTIYHNQVELDCLFLEDIFKSNHKSQINVSENLVKEVICQLKNGKAADSAGISKDLTSITKYHKQLLKQLQHLPDKATDSASYLLLGEPPIKAEIHKRIFTTFGNIVRNFDSIEHQLAWRQLATKSNSSNSWFIMVKTLLEMYDLPPCYDLLQNPPGKSTWKNLVKSTVNSFWEQKLKLEAKTKSSLKFIDIDRLSIGKTHLIWSSAGSDTFAITKASVKCRMLLGVYTLQANRHRFNQFEVDPSCPLCKQGPEDRTHFLVLCQHFTSVRQPFMEALKIVMREMLPDLHQQITSDPLLLTQVILDCSSSPFVQPQYYNRLECLSRGLCYALHIARSTALEYHYK